MLPWGDSRRQNWSEVTTMSETKRIGWSALRVLVGLVAVVVIALSMARSARAAFIFAYTGTLTRAGADIAGLEGATFTLTAEFQSSPYVDNGLGLPSLPID